MTDDPLPEPSFKWRRLLTFAVVAVNSAGVAWIIAKVDDARALMWIGLALILSNVVFAVLYMAGASAADLARIVEGASIAKAKVNVGKTEPPETEG